MLVRIRWKQIVDFSIQSSWGREEKLFPLRRTQPWWALLRVWSQVAVIRLQWLPSFSSWRVNSQNLRKTHWAYPWLYFTWLGKPAPAVAPSVHHPPLQLYGSRKTGSPKWSPEYPNQTHPWRRAASLFFLTQVVLTLSRRAGKEGDRA